MARAQEEDRGTQKKTQVICALPVLLSVPCTVAGAILVLDCIAFPLVAYGWVIKNKSMTDF